MTDNALALAQSALAAISSLQTQVAVLSGQIHAQGGTVTPQGQTVTGSTGTIQSETSARAAADAAIGSRIEDYRSDLKGADAVATSKLEARTAAESRDRNELDDKTVELEITAGVIKCRAPAGPCIIGNLEGEAAEPQLQVDPGKAVEPLRLGKVTFYGESARVIRDAQAVLESAGAGQLEVVKRTNEAGKPFAVVDGQLFMSTADVLKASINPAQFKVNTEKLQGRYVITGIGAGVQPGKPRVIIAQELLDEIQKQISESSLGKNLSNLEDRLNAVELSRVTQKGLDEATAARFGQQIDALQAQVDLLQVNVNSRG